MATPARSLVNKADTSGLVWPDTETPLAGTVTGWLPTGSHILPKQQFNLHSLPIINVKLKLILIFHILLSNNTVAI